MSSPIAAESRIINAILFDALRFFSLPISSVQLFTVPDSAAVVASHFNRPYDYKIPHARVHVRDLSQFIRSLPVAEASIQGRVPLPSYKAGC